MTEFTITRHIDASIESVWAVINDFGGIQRWNGGVKASELTSLGPVGEGSTRHCDFVPFGAVNERIIGYEPNQRMTIDLFETHKLPISHAIADFHLTSADSGTDVRIEYSYTLNRFGRAAKNYTDKQLRNGLGGLADGLRAEASQLERTDAVE